MRTHKKWRFRLLSVLLVLSMAVGIMPTAAFAAQETGTEATSKNVAIVQSYAAQMMNANKKSDYTAGKFSWDTEGKSDSWRYFNGVMLDAFMMVGDSDMTSYVDAVLSDNVDSNGTCANYKVGELDSVPMALAMFDLLDSSANAEKYKKAIQYVYTQLEGQVTYDSCGGNMLHKQDTSGNPTGGWSTWNIGLDGLYMAQPFLMECANAIDSGKLTLKDKSGSAVTSESIYAAVYNRFAWVAENMYDSTTGLYHHGWNVSENKGNGHFWGRGIGWYAVALVDVIDMMPTTYQTQMTPYLTKLFDGMLKYQDADTGMWYNVVTQTTGLSKNILETSVSSMMAYSLMKAYNRGFVTDAKYGAAGLAAFNGVVANKVTGSEGSYKVADTYLKSGVGTTDAYYTANGYTVDEAKGTGALIMAATQANAAAEKLNAATEPTVPEALTDEATGVTVSGSGASEMTVTDKSRDTTVIAALANKLENGFAAYDITLTGYTQGAAATVTMPAPQGADTVYYVAEDGVTEEITGATFDGGKATFTATHFSTYAAGKAVGASESGGAADSASASGTLPGGTTYVLDTDGVDDGATYLIVSASSGNAYALRNNNGKSDRQSVSISNNVATIRENEDTSTWTFTQSSSSWNVKNGSTYLRLNKDLLGSESRTLTVTPKGSGAYRITYDKKDLRYDNGWTRGDKGDTYYVYLFKQTTAPEKPVTLTVTPNSASLKPGETINLVGSVLVDSAAATSSEITWSSSNAAVASVANGAVTANADGTATITATLTSANGLAPTGTVQVEILITVTSKTISSAVLTGNDPVTTKKGVEPDFSNIKLTVTYDDNTTAAITTANGLTISGYNKDEIGVYYATISYQGKEYDPVKVTVEGNPYEGLEEATEYPEYPADGAVRIDKTATGQDFNSTGVVKVELDAAGISVKQGVDVVVVLDMSNSMLWEPGTTTPVTNGNKFEAAKTATQSFASVILGSEEDGTPTNNTMSLVYFCSMDDERNTDTACPNTVDTALNRSSNLNDAIAAINNLGTANGNTPAFGYDETNSKYNWPGGTNYDYAFEEANEIVTALKSDSRRDQSRDIYILFMSDGAPGYYNGVYYKSGSSEYRSTAYTDSTKTTKYSMSNTTYDYSSGANGNFATLWGNHIKESLNGAETAKNNGAIIYSIGFDVSSGNKLETGNAWTNISASDLTECLKGISSDNHCYNADSNADLQTIFANLATKIKYAGTNAKVTDTIDSNFTLQTTSFGTTVSQPASIDVTAYDLYTKAETSDNSLIGTRKGDSTVMETVTFNKDGTQAYSSVLGETTNIMTTDADGMVTIAAQYFTYTKDTSGVEKFVWNIGNITDKEVALSFYAYLKGSKEGTCAEGVYYTNEGATIEYVDINGKHASKEFPIPAVAWGGASTSFEYYLVNYKGEPVNRAGQVVPFANRIVLYGDTVALNLNQDLTIPAQNINAAQYLPEGYFLYDVNACYTVSVSSDGVNNGITVSVPSEDAKKTTGEGSAQVTQTGAQTTIEVSHGDNYIQSRVAFGVRWDLTPIFMEYELVKDQTVMDYGKAIQVNVLTNDTTIPSGYTGTLVGFTAYNAKTNLKQAQQSAGSTEYTTANGTYTIVDGKANFQPNTMLSSVEKVFCVVKVTKNDDTSNYYYLYEELDIIPATIMYYETDFASGVFSLTNGTTQKWSTKQDNQDTSDEVQNSGAIGVNQTYGFDSTYADDAIYSNGSSLMVEGEKMDTGYTGASFSFTGTGFDLISRTGANQGLIQVNIYAGEAAEPTKTVKVLNKSESNLELYQIPVASVNDLAYGTYRVTIDVYNAVTYTGSMESLSRGGEFYFDAIRVYNPIDVTAGTSDAATARSAYIADGEANNQIIEVRQKIIEKQTYDDGSGVVDNSVVFVDRTSAGVEVADYTTIGPNNEVYLSKDQGIAFKLTSTEVPASIDIGAKSADGGAVSLNASLYSLQETEVNGEMLSKYSASISQDISSSTALFYNLMAEAEVTTAEILSGGGAYVCIFNDGEGILSITDLKVAYGTQPGVVALSVDSNTLPKAGGAMGAGEEDVPNYDILSASFDKATCKLRKNATMTVVTTDDVKSLVVTDKKGREVKAGITSTTENGQTTWKLSIKMTVAGKQSYTVTGYSAGGTAGAPASATINVTRK